MVIACPNCGKKLRISDELAGQQRPCPACKQPLAIPKAGAPAGPPLRHTSSSPSGAGAGRPRTVAASPGPPDAPHAQVSAGGPTPPLAGGAASVVAPPGATPPPLPPTVGRRPIVGGPPPLPPGATSKKHPGGQRTLPGTSPGGAGNAIGLVIQGLVRALSVHKLAYFLVGVVVFGLIFAVLAAAPLWMSARSESLVIQILCLLAISVLGVGLLGVLVGGMAHLAHVDESGGRGTLVSAFGFCGRRCVSLFAGAVMFGVAVLTVLYAIHKMILMLNDNRTVGSLLASVLFLPQFLINVGLVLALIVGVLIPIIIAAEDASALQAIRRVLQCVRCDTGRLLVHLATSILIGLVISVVLGSLVGGGLVMTWVSNGADLESTFLSMFMENSHGPWGDRLRLFCTSVVVCVVVGYLLAYWVGSFTGYYKDTLRRQFGAGAG